MLSNNSFFLFIVFYPKTSVMMTRIYIQYSRYDTRKTLYGLASTSPPPAIPRTPVAAPGDTTRRHKSRRRCALLASRSVQITQSAVPSHSTVR